MISPIFRGYASKPEPKPRSRFTRRRLLTIFLGLSVIEAVVLSGLAWAGSDLFNRNCVTSGGLLSCVTQWRFDDGNGPAPVRAVPRDAAPSDAAPRGALPPAIVPPAAAPRDARAQAEAGERERKWRERCRPVIRQDADGLSRYHYAKPGCEFGKFED